MTGKIINLRQWRKSQTRAEAKAEADRNAVLHGLPRDVTDLARARADKERREHAAHEIEESTPE